MIFLIKIINLIDYCFMYSIGGGYVIEKAKVVLLAILTGVLLFTINFEMACMENPADDRSRVSNAYNQYFDVC